MTEQITATLRVLFGYTELTNLEEPQILPQKELIILHAIIDYIDAEGKNISPIDNHYFQNILDDLAGDPLDKPLVLEFDLDISQIESQLALISGRKAREVSQAFQQLGHYASFL